jgi:hypothetical protein
MDAHELLKRVTIPSPCPAKWESMPGGDRVRSCSACGKQVYNFEALTSDEAASLIATRGEDLCGRFTRAADGAIITSQSASSRRPTMGGPRFHIRSLMALIAGIAAALGLAKVLSPTSESTRFQGRIVFVRPICEVPPAANPPDVEEE